MTATSSARRVSLAGADFDPISHDELLNRVTRAIQARANRAYLTAIGDAAGRMPDADEPSP